MKIFFVTRISENKSIIFYEPRVAHKNVPIFFGNNFYENKETFKNIFPEILEVYRVLVVQTILESIMF